MEAGAYCYLFFGRRGGGGMTDQNCFADAAHEHGPEPAEENPPGEAADGTIEQDAVGLVAGPEAGARSGEESGEPAGEKDKFHGEEVESSSGRVRRTIAPGTSSSQSPVSDEPVERKSGSRVSSKR